MKELEFIQYIARKFRAKKPVVRGIGDDCAVISYTKNKYLLLTCDMIIEGTHFTRKATPYQIGWKGVAVNISDIAAMGGIPKYALVSAGIPRGRNLKFLKDLTRGIEEISRKFDISVIGGDTNASGKTVLNVTLMGEVEKKRLVTRSGAKTGDLIFVTGALGEGKEKHLKFLPRLKEARILTKNFKINSMIDLSDGLNLDLNRLAKASKIGARIYKSLIPLSEKSLSLRGGGPSLGLGVDSATDEAPQNCGAILWDSPVKCKAFYRAISSGEDFELLFTASINESKKIIKRMGHREDLPITMIGEVVDKRFGVTLVEEEGKARPLRPKGFAHL